MESKQPAAAALLGLLRWRLQIRVVRIELAHQDVPVLAVLLLVLFFGETAILNRFDEVDSSRHCFFRKWSIVTGKRVGLLLEQLRQCIGDQVNRLSGGARGFAGHILSVLGAATSCAAEAVLRRRRSVLLPCHEELELLFVFLAQLEERVFIENRDPYATGKRDSFTACGGQHDSIFILCFAHVIDRILEDLKNIIWLSQHQPPMADAPGWDMRRFGTLLAAGLQGWGQRCNCLIF